MNKSILPITGVAVVLAVGSFYGLNFMFPHDKVAKKDTSIKADDIFAARVDESVADGSAIVAEAEPAPVIAEGGTETVADANAEASSDPTAVDAAATDPAATDATATDTAATDASAAPEATAEPVPVETAAAPEPAPEPTPEPVAEPVAASQPTPPAPSGLSRQELAKIVADAAAKAAAETAKEIAEQAARDAAAR